MKDYDKRDAKLLELGYASYRAYLDSPLWKKIRLKFLNKFPTCCVCGKAANTVHHKFYSKRLLLGKHDVGLRALCSACHQECEFDGDKKRARVQANRVLEGLAFHKKVIELHLCIRCRLRKALEQQNMCEICSQIEPNYGNYGKQNHSTVRINDP